VVTWARLAVPALSSLSRSVLAARLDHLVGAGILARAPYQEAGQRRRYQYVLTGMGEDLIPVLTALGRWGDTYLADPEGPAPLSTHAGCGAPAVRQAARLGG
jgi:DNA-binding HxlR family transcriptional regulator